MRIRSFLALAMLITLIFPSELFAANPKAGAKCPTLGLTLNYAGKKYTCLRSGKNLIWNKGVTIKTSSTMPKPNSTPTSTPTSNPSPTPTAKPTESSSPSPKPSPARGNPADQINGQLCTKENQRIRNTVNEFWCFKASDGVLRWNENYRFYDPNPRVALPPIKYEVNQYIAPKYVGTSIETCKIKENSDQGNLRGDLASGFPFMSRFSTFPKNVKMALVPIDFVDLEGDGDFKARVSKEMQYLSDWYRDVSGGRLTVEWVVNDTWIRMPGVSSDYYVESSGKYPDTIEFWKKVLPVVDSKMNLAGVQTINFLFPPKQQFAYESVQSFSFLNEMKEYNSKVTKIYSFTGGGEVFEAGEANLWSYWAHEFGHELGLAHVGSSRGQVEPMNGLDLLGSQDGPYRDLSGWMRFIIGWLDENQVYCQDTSLITTNEISLVPLSDSKNGVKVVVIPTSSDSAIVIESRRPTKYSCDIPNLPGGVLVYTYNAKLGNQSYFLTAHYPNGRQPNIRCQTGSTYPDVLLHTGDSVIVANYEVTVVSSGTFDQIRISRRS